MKKIILSVFVLTGTFFVSCEDDNKINENVSVYLPSKIYGDTGPVTFKYDNKNRLIEVRQGDSQTAYILTTLNYNGDVLATAQVIEVANEYTGTEDYTFTYQNNQVTAKITYASSNGGTSNDEEVFSIDNKGRLTAIYDGVAVYDAKGNLIKIQNPYDESTFEYDTKNGIFKNVKTPQWAFIYVLGDYYTNIINNVTKIDYKDFEENQHFTESISYEYNQDNYPVKMQVSQNDYYVKIEYTKN